MVTEAQRQEAEENQWQDVTLVIRRLDAAAQRDSGVPKFFQQFGSRAVFVAGVRFLVFSFALCHALRASVSVKLGRRKK